MREHVAEAVGVGGEPVARNQILLDQHRDQRGEQPRVGAGLHLEVDVRDLRGLGAARVHHDQAARGVLRDLAQRRSRARDAVREPRVLAQEQRHLAVLEVGARIAADHLLGDPELAGLLLRERTRAVDRAERRARAARVGAGQMVPLPAATVVEDRLAAVRVAHRGEALRDLADRGVPVDLLEAAVGAAAQRHGQPVRAVLVVIEPRRLLARIAARGRVGVVAAYAHQTPAVFAAELHLDPAVALAQDAGGRFPVGDGRCVGGHGASSRRAGGSSAYQFSPKGRRSSSKVQAERSWCTTWWTASAIPLDWMKKSSGRSGNALRVHGTSITASVTT